MSTITTRSGKGSPLTHDEVDSNFTNLNTDKYESGDSPSFAGLTVASDSSYAIDVSRPSAGNTTLRITGGTTAGNDVVFRADIGNTTGTSAIYFGDSTTNGIGRIMYEHDGDYMRFFTVSAERMRIDNTGKVGIGTSSPDANGLTISSVGSEMIHLISSHSTKTYIEAEGGSGSMWRLGTVDSNPDVRLEAMYPTGDIKFITNSSERMYITSAGNVGIGTTSPSGMLHLSGALPRIYLTDTDTATVSTFSGENGWLTLSAATSRITFNIAGSEKMRIVGDDVGIGTTSPSQKLTVSGTDARIYLTGANTDIDMDNSASGQLSLDGNAYAFGIALNSSGANLYTNSVSRDLIFGVNETEVMRVTNDNVRIGTSSPSDTLTVAGTGNFSGNVTASHFVGTATEALYADLAEKYVADAHYEPGTVMVIGGDKEVTASNSYMDPTVSGIVSTNPAFLMNKDLTAEHVVDLALTGRVPCKVHGIINRGDMIVSGNIAGVGTSCTDPKFGTVVGKALENYNSKEVGIIEVIAGRL